MAQISRNFSTMEWPAAVAYMAQESRVMNTLNPIFHSSPVGGVQRKPIEHRRCGHTVNVGRNWYSANQCRYCVLVSGMLSLVTCYRASPVLCVLRYSDSKQPHHIRSSVLDSILHVIPSLNSKRTDRWYGNTRCFLFKQGSSRKPCGGAHSLTEGHGTDY